MRRAPNVPLLLAVACGLAGPVRAQAPAPRPNVADDFVAAGAPAPLPAPLPAALAGLRAEALAAHVAFLASPALAGRGLGSRGLDAAAEYVAAQLALAGVEPLTVPSTTGEKAVPSYFAALPLRQIDRLEGDVTVERRAGDSIRTVVFTAGVDCTLPEIAPRSITAPVVFAGAGIREPALGHDDYRSLDVKGRIVLITAGVPPGPEWQTKELLARYAATDPDERWQAKLDTARALGAVAVLGVEGPWIDPKDPELAIPERVFLPLEPPAAGTLAPLVRVSPVVAAAMFGDGPAAAAFPPAEPRAMTGVTATVSVRGEGRIVTSRNVLAVIPGADPSRRDEAVVVGAHLDHLGESRGVVYPGADDNASGVAALLEIARALAALPTRPARTVVLAFWTGEEEGKLGSGWYVRHPAWPLDRTKAYVNLDMIGHPWLAEEIRTLVRDAGLPGGDAFLAGVKPAEFTEAGLPRGDPALPAVLRQAARGTGLALHLDWTDGTHGGSDYRDFARAGVPFIRFFGNFFPAYHEPGDTAAALDPAQVQRIARLALASVWLLANR